jgi:hypothetical protein
MRPEPLSLTAQTLHAELREIALALGTTENLGETPGTIVPKTVRGNSYLYYQYRDLDGQTKQAYLGPDDAATGRLVERIRKRSEDRAEDLRRLDELRAAFVAAGSFVSDHAPLRVLKAFADSGLLRPGPEHAVLVGTHAFNALGNLLGVRWASRMQTQDIDIAAHPGVDIAVRGSSVSAPDVLTQLGMGFIPVPALDSRSPSTSFRVRGQDLRVDLLTPLVGKAAPESTFIPALNAPAQRIRFLDYLIQETVPALIVGSRLLVLVNVPAPARYALHKVLVSEVRPAAFVTKAEKDRVQAAQLLAVLAEQAPHELALAKADLVSRGKGWRDKLRRGLGRSRPLAPDAVDLVIAM